MAIRLKTKQNQILTAPVISLPFPACFLSNAALLGVIHRLVARFSAFGRRREELGEGVDEALGLVVEVQAAVRLVVVSAHREKQPVVAGVTLAGGAGGRVGRGGALPPTAATQLLEGPARPVRGRAEVLLIL